MNTVPAFIPQNLDLEKFLAEHEPDFEYNIDNFRYIISLITEIPAYNKDLLDEHNYVPINAKLLQTRVRAYDKYLKYLLKHEVFETDGIYIPQEKARGYRFTHRYSTYVKVELIKKASLVKQLTKKSKFELNKERKYRKLRSWFNDDLKIDFVAGLHYLEDQFNINKANGVENAILKFNSSFVSLYRLHNEDFFFKVDKNVGRLHTNLTVMKSELRNFITVGGQKMVSVDITNSQPFLSAILLDENFFKNGENRQNEVVSSKLDINTLKSNKFKKVQTDTIASHIMVVKSSESQANVDLQTYKRYVVNGTIYEYIRDEIEKQMGERVTDRRKLKEIIFTVLFTDNRFIGQAEARPKRIFKKLFPTVYEVFSMVKKGDPTVLPRLLQTIESYLILNKIAIRISKAMPEVPIFTIHDSVACPIQFQDKVADIIREEITKATGITPHLKFDVWDPQKIKLSSNLAA